MNQNNALESTACAYDPVAAYYERKTESILRRYGPGPRVHFHTGFFDQRETFESAPQFRAAIHESQERMLRDVTKLWNFRTIPFKDVLDVGCGLGGTAIFCAQEFASNVTAITIAPSHIDLVAAFASDAGVRSRVRPLLCDALEVVGDNRFDAILSLDSSCYLPRGAWFRRVFELLRPGGRLFLADCFVENEAYRAPFDSYWCARIGEVDRYIAEASKAGLTLERRDDVSSLVSNFWATTTALILLEANEARGDLLEMSRLQKSIEIHSLMRDGLLDGGYRHMLLSLLKPRS